MDKARKKNSRRVISLVCAICVVALLAAMPLLAKQDGKEDGPRASILSDTVTTGSINAELIGGGTLAEDDAMTISVPAAVKLTEFLVSNGQTVTEGTPIASVDRVTVMTAISQVQETLEYLSEQIEEASDTDSEESVTALAGGTVIGSGQLYIYSPWNATAYTGTVKGVKVSEGDQLSAGKTIMVLEDVGYSATYRQLIGQRQEYEDLILILG